MTFYRWVHVWWDQGVVGVIGPKQVQEERLWNELVTCQYVSSLKIWGLCFVCQFSIAFYLDTRIRVLASSPEGPP